MALKWYHLLPFPLLPALCAFTSLLLRLAQGEKAEELAFGVMVGILLDLIYGAVLLWLTRQDR